MDQTLATLCVHCNQPAYSAMHISGQGKRHEFEPIVSQKFPFNFKRKMIYLAAPYSHKDIGVRHARFEIVNRAAVALVKKGHFVFSPISHTHPIALAGNLPTSWEYWQEYDQRMIEMVDMLVVLKIEGWQESIGIREEVKIAQNTAKLIHYCTMIELETTEI